MTHRTQSEFESASHCCRRVVANFEGGTRTSDESLLLLREVASRLGIFRRLARCFTDFRSRDRCEHGVDEMLAQRVLSLAMGYEDLNDHDPLRHDPLLSLGAGKRDAEALAGKSTLRRLEGIRKEGRAGDRYKPIGYNQEAIDRLLVELFLHARGAARAFTEFGYRTCKSWSRRRRVVAKAEQIQGKENPRYVVTSLAAGAWKPRALYEQLYCARGEMENRIKEQLSLFADRVSAATMRANQLRLYLSAMAYTLIENLRRTALAGTELARAQATTIRLRLLKIGARLKLSARRFVVTMPTSYQLQGLFQQVWRGLRC